MNRSFRPLLTRHAAPGALAAVTLAVLHLGAAAQTAGQLQTITVTAERRVENIREVPSSVSALQGETLEVINSGGQDVRALSGRVPSLNIESSFGRAFPRFYLRGYGNTDFRANASQPVSLIYDDVVQESPLLKGFPMFDLDQVEVLAGPQGSLFGRNTPAGVVKFDSAKPRIGASDGFASLSFGTYKTTNLEAGKSVPISSELSARVSLLAQYRDNWVHNTYAAGPTQDMEGYKDNAARVQLLYKPRADFSALFNVHARDLHGTARVFRANIFKQGTNELVDGFDPAQVSLDGRNEQSIQIVGSNARLSWDLGGYSLYSITGYETVHSYSRGDIDGGYGAAFLGAGKFGPGPIPFPSETAGGLHGHHQLTQEFRVESRNAGPLNWQAGVYYFNEDFISNSFGYGTLAGGGQTSLLTDQQKSTSWAGFGSVKYDVTPAFSLRAGLRYTKDTKDLNSDATAGVNTGNGTTAHLGDSKPTADLSLLYKLDRDTNVYARVATGYRGSSVEPASAFGPQSLAGQETTVSYEAGVKADLFNRRARVALSVFHYDVKDLQLTEVGGGGNTNTLKTAKKAVGQGVELTLNAYATDNLLLTLSGSINDTQIKDPSLTVGGCGSGRCTVTNRVATTGQYYIDGNPLPQAPKYVANVNARYSIPVSGGEFFVFTDWSYRSKVNFFLYEATEFTGKPLLEGGLRVGYNWGAGKYEVAAFGRNITNKVVAVGAIDFNNLTGFINDPRTFGVQFKAQF
jgi:iron complex outermembrane receptor protein